MNPSVPFATDNGNDASQKCSKNPTSQDANKTTATKKRRQIDRSHITTLPGDPQMYKCTICERVFRNVKGMCYHDACATGIRPYRCDICEKSFVKRSHFEYHERVHTGYKPFKCPLCDKAFPEKSRLNRHMISHKQEKQFFCQKCDKRYSKKEDLRNHMSVHTGLSQHVCKSCGKAYITSANLVRHMHTHSNERPYACDFCTKSFKYKSLLMRHKKTHGKDRPFSCAHCSRFFLSKSELGRHMAIHTDVKPFSCTYCQTVFRRKDNLNRHIRHHHAEHSASSNSGKPEKESEEPEDARNSSDAVAPAAVGSKSIRIKKSKVKKSSKAAEIVSLSTNSTPKPQALTLVNSRDETSRKDSLVAETTSTVVTLPPSVPIPIRRPGELSNAVPVINGPIMGKNIAMDCGQRKKTFTYTEPIPLAEAVVINRRIEEKLYPQSSGSNLSNNYYFFRKHSSMSDSTTIPLSHSLDSESYSLNSAKPAIVTCNRVQIGSGSKREVLSHTYSISSTSDLSNSNGAAPIRGKGDTVTPKIIHRRTSFDKHETQPKHLDFTDRKCFSGIESANSVPTIRINKRMYLQEKRVTPVTAAAESSNN